MAYKDAISLEGELALVSSNSVLWAPPPLVSLALPLQASYEHNIGATFNL